MASEIERKFLVTGDSWGSEVTAMLSLRQAYLARTELLSVRVRIVDGKDAFLSVKSSGAGAVRSEYEYAIPVGDALELMELREGGLIEKTRHIVAKGGARWEVDVFGGDLAGLIVAEVELEAADSAFERPAWLGREVTGDPAYYNATLALAGLPPDVGDRAKP